jgi:hypothetical protein
VMWSQIHWEMHTPWIAILDIFGLPLLLYQVHNLCFQGGIFLLEQLFARLQKLLMGLVSVKLNSTDNLEMLCLLLVWYPLIWLVRCCSFIQEEVPVINFVSTGIIRCRRCRTYVNPHVTFTDSGRKWCCNICALLNEGKSQVRSKGNW